MSHYYAQAIGVRPLRLTLRGSDFICNSPHLITLEKYIKWNLTSTFHNFDKYYKYILRLWKISFTILTNPMGFTSDRQWLHLQFSSPNNFGQYFSATALTHQFYLFCFYKKDWITQYGDDNETFDDNDDNYYGQWWYLKWTIMTIIMENGGNYNGQWWKL